MKLRVLAACCVAALTVLPLAAESKDVPTSGVISESGSYVLQDARMSSDTSSPAIMIMANDVTLDLNGECLKGPGGKSGVGVMIQGASGVVVMNGFISNMAFGVIVDSSHGVRLSKLQIRAQGLPVAALPPETGIMLVESSNVVVEDNSIYNTGLGIFVRGGMSKGNTIRKNTVTGGTNGLLGICFNPADNDPKGAGANVVTENYIANFATGIQASGVSRFNVFKGNFILFTTGTAIERKDPINFAEDNSVVQVQ